jgi:dihydropyrimidinase
MAVDYSAFEGMQITGRVVTTMSRGRVIVSDGELRGAAGHGKFISRDLNQYLT